MWFDLGKIHMDGMSLEVYFPTSYVEQVIRLKSSKGQIRAKKCMVLINVLVGLSNG